MRKAFFVAAILAAFTIDEAWSECTTRGRPCIFPFYHGGQKFTACTISKGHTMSWCAYKVDKNSNMIRWGYCDYNCKMQGKPTTANNTTVNPQMSSTTTTATSTTTATFSAFTTKLSVDERHAEQYHPDNSPGSCYCGVPNSRSDRIVGGEETEIGEYPWQVALLNSQMAESFFCGGTLVSDRHIVSAAHCCMGNKASEVFVFLGGTILAGNLSSDPRGGQLLSVSNISQHDEFDVSTHVNDICVLEVEPIDLKVNPSIKPACLPSAYLTVTQRFPGQAAVTSGWGITTPTGRASTHLRDVTLQIHNSTDCGETSPGPVADGQFCAAIPAGGKDACRGDSGGPLITKDEADNNGAATLIGVVSWGGIECGQRNLPGMYTEVSYFLRSGWLRDRLEGGDTCPPPLESDWVIRDLDSAPSPTEMSVTSPDTTTTSTTSTTKMSVTSPDTTTTFTTSTTKMSVTSPATTTTSTTSTQWTAPDTTTAATTTTKTIPATTIHPIVPGPDPCAEEIQTAPNVNIAHCDQPNTLPELVAYKTHERIEKDDLCRLICNHEDVCQYWSWQKTAHVCSLYKNDVEFQPNQEFYSGQKYC